MVSLHTGCMAHVQLESNALRGSCNSLLSKTVYTQVGSRRLSATSLTLTLAWCDGDTRVGMVQVAGICCKAVA